MDECPLLSGSSFLFCGGVKARVVYRWSQRGPTPGLALMSCDSKIPHESEFPILTKTEQPNNV